MTATQQETFTRTWASPKGARGFFTDVNHKTVGARYMVTAFIFFLIGGLLALLMRIQLAVPENDFLSPDRFNELFTMHGTTMMFLFAVPFLEGLATYLLPLQIGCRDMPFPRYNAFNYWCYLAAGILLYSSFIVGMVPDSGWFAYVPLSGPEFADTSMDFWLFGLALAEIAAIGAAVEIVVAILRMRAPGMSLDRIPVFAWTMLAVALLIIVAFIPLLVATLLLEMDRAAGTTFFDVAGGGDPLLWQHLFWIFGHPEVYIIFLPGAAIISHVVPAHARQKLVAYPLVVVAVIATALMSLGLWVHHMYAVGLPPLTLSFFSGASMAITLATGIQIFAWIATLWLGRPRFTLPMLYTLGFIFTFVAGGITGVMVASAGFNAQVHDTYFIVAHLHYVLIGGMLFPVMAGFHHWWPKFFGRTIEGPPGHVAFWLILIGFHLTFFPMHLSGMWGMPRRVYTYAGDFGLDVPNLLSTIGTVMLGAGVLVLTVYLIASFRRPRETVENPWHADTLEWSSQSPAPGSNWPRIPVVTSRYPGWEQPEAPAEHVEMAEAFDHQPETFRASPTTTIVQAEPLGAVRLSMPSFWPFVPPLGLVTAAVGMLAEVYPVVFIGLAVLVVGLLGWARHNESDAEEQASVAVGGKYASERLGPAGLGWWGALAVAVLLAHAVGTIAFSTLFLQVGNPEWPRSETVDQPVLSVAVLVALGVALAATWWGARTLRGQDPAASRLREQHLGAAAITLLVGIAALVLLVVIWLRADMDHTFHAYNSAVLLLLGAQGLAILFGIGATVVALIARLVHLRDARAATMLQNAAIVWVGTIVCWLLVWGTTDLLPAIGL